MQIRLGNRQDEPIIRTIAATALEELIGSSTHEDWSDLIDIEANYFWHDGIFIVAEADGQIIGLAGARKKDDDQLQLTRLAVVPENRRSGVARALVDTVLYFASDSDYKSLVVIDEPKGSEPVLASLGFSESKDRWKQPVKARVI